jgi:hypothetical protein
MLLDYFIVAYLLSLRARVGLAPQSPNPSRGSGVSKTHNHLGVQGFGDFLGLHGRWALSYMFSVFGVMDPRVPMIKNGIAWGRSKSLNMPLQEWIFRVFEECFF